MIEIKELHKAFDDQVVLHDLSVTFREGAITGIIGPSGSGKSTLLNIIGLIETYDAGTVSYWGDETIRPFTRQARQMLAKQIGYLFQNYALIDNETVEYNLLIALSNSKMSRIEKDHAINQALTQVGLADFKTKRIYQCSGGEQQRIALARLILKDSRLILADEPTGSLDEHNKQVVLRHIRQLNEAGKTILIATHDPVVIEFCDELLELTDSDF